MGVLINHGHFGQFMSLSIGAALAERGAVGALALAVFGLVIWVGYVRCVRETHVPVQSAAYGLGFGLVAEGHWNKAQLAARRMEPVQWRSSEAAAEYLFRHAIDRYRLALRKSYNQAGWRYELASLLARVGRAEEAMHEARICLRLRPNYTPARRLIEELSTRPVEPVASGRSCPSALRSPATKAT